MGKVGKFAAISLSLLTISGSALAVIKKHDISDWRKLRGYEAPSEIASLSERTAMTDKGRKLFYVYDPQLLSKDGFNLACTIGEHSIVLGCYDGSGIYLYDITDVRLDGVEEVTSAHEMLHAAYERLSSKEKKRIDALTAEAIEKSGSTRIRELVEAYRARDPSTVNNEMHSIVGTEMRDIPAELEEYYSRYFLNRERVVEYAEKYEAVFISLDAEVDRIDADLLLRKAEIDNLEASLEFQAREIAAWEARLNGFKANNQIAEYNSELNGFNNSVRAYNAKLTKTRKLIEEYNQKVIERNNLALQQNQLIKSLDSKAVDL